jgi:hypothetical protein
MSFPLVSCWDLEWTLHLKKLTFYLNQKADLENLTFKLALLVYQTFRF